MSEQSAALSKQQLATLRALAAAILPASAAYQVPGADDPEIFARIAAAAGALGAVARDGLAALEAESQKQRGSAFAALDADARAALAQGLDGDPGAFVARIASLTVQCYYSDPRVMAALGMPPRPPFPKGFEVEQGDLSLLDPVKQRAKIYREV